MIVCTEMIGKFDDFLKNMIIIKNQTENTNESRDDIWSKKIFHKWRFCEEYDYNQEGRLKTLPCVYPDVMKITLAFLWRIWLQLRSQIENAATCVSRDDEKYFGVFVKNMITIGKADWKRYSAAYFLMILRITTVPILN